MGGNIDQTIRPYCTAIDSPFPVQIARVVPVDPFSLSFRNAAQTLRPSRVPVPRTANTLVARLTAPSHVLPRLRAAATCWHQEEPPLSVSNDKRTFVHGRFDGPGGRCQADVRDASRAETVAEPP